MEAWREVVPSPGESSVMLPCQKIVDYSSGNGVFVMHFMLDSKFTLAVTCWRSLFQQFYEGYFYIPNTFKPRCM